MKNNILKKLLVLLFKGLRFLLKFALMVFADYHEKTLKEKHEPTLEEVTLGEKLPMTDEYYFP